MMQSSGVLRQILLLLLCFCVSVSIAVPDSILQLIPGNPRSSPHHQHRTIQMHDVLYCDSWRYTVETNDAGPWDDVPSSCITFVKDYITGLRYQAESEAVANASLDFAKTVTVSGSGKDAWVFDIDETLLSNYRPYAVHGFRRSNIFDEISSNDDSEAPALPASLRLYRELKHLGFTIFLLTGRPEARRNATIQNLEDVGYSNWKRLILRGPYDKYKSAKRFKSERRQELEDEGYIIHGNSGDQWSDLNGFAVAKRSFKLPNPMYYIA